MPTILYWMERDQKEDAMTCIVGLAEQGVVYLGGDSAAVSSYSKTIQHDPKVFKKGQMLFGTCGSVRMRQLLQYKLDIPPCECNDVMTYLATVFIDAVRLCFKEGGLATEEQGREKGGKFLLGFQGELFYVDYEYDIGRMAFPYFAIGCADEIAFGSLCTTARLGMPPLQRLTLALQAAEQHNTEVCAPFVYISSQECAYGA